MNVGDWVKIRSDKHPNIKMKIIEMRKYVDPNTSTNFVRVRYYDKWWVNGKDMSGWENAYEYELDIQRIREEKLNELGI
jgi:hypothetical protein